MQKKRERYDIINDILIAVRDKNNRIKSTPLLYASNLSPKMHKNYISELTEKGLIKETTEKKSKYFSLTEKGFQFLERFQIFRDFVEGFGL